MAEINTDSYKVPQSKSPMEVIGEVQNLEKNRLGIDKAKLDQINQGYGYLIRELNSLGANPTQDDLMRVGQNAVKMKLVTPEMYGQFVKTIPTDPRMIPGFRDEITKKFMSTAEVVNATYGATGAHNDGANTTYTRQPLRGGPNAVAPPIANQIPPTAQTIRPDGSTELYGAKPPRIPPGAIQAPGGIPSQYIQPGAPDPNAPMVPNRVQTQPIRPPAPTNRLSIQTPPPTFAQRFDNSGAGVPTGQAPGVAEAAKVTGAASGDMLASALKRSQSYPSEIFPLTEAVAALERLGPKNTGPFGETKNTIKSFMQSNLPGFDASTFDNTVTDFDKAKKYFTDYVNRTGNSGTNDKLAAAFAGNPSVNISNAAAVDVAKAAIALRNMEQAQTIAWDNAKANDPSLTDDKFASWSSRWNRTQDPRAYGLHLMTEEALKKLQKEYYGEGSKKTKSEREAFEISGFLANKMLGLGR